MSSAVLFVILKEAQAEIPTKKPRVSTLEEMASVEFREQQPNASNEAAVDPEDVEIMEIKMEIPEEYSAESIEHSRVRRIIYHGKMTEPQDVTSLLDVGCVANELQVYAAVSFCASNLAKKVQDAENVWRILDFAHLIADVKLEETCFETIRDDTGSILQTEGFLRCSRATLEFILKQDTLCNVTELQLFQACAAWGNANSGEAGSCKAALGSVLCWIRFRTISAADFAKYVCPTGLLCVEHERDIMRSCLTGENYMPLGASIQTRRRSAGQGEILEIKIATSGERMVLEKLQEATAPLCFSANRDAYILGVKMRAWRSNEITIGYEEIVYVSLQEDVSLFSDILARTAFRGQVKKGEMLTIKFNRPCKISSDTSYLLYVKYARRGGNYRTCDLYKKQELQKSKNGLKIRVLDKTVAPPELHLIIAE
ncbi:hypothetical protein B566_EDAN008530 [Ephemera danica]|nr:hypothetical protein B566_EDAN008530 [Ephemera danica]